VKRLAVIIALLGLASSPAAAATDFGWRVRPEFSVVASANYARGNGEASGYSTASAVLELELRPEARPYRITTFVSYSAADDRRHDAQFNFGAYASYDLARWDTTSWLVVNKSPGNPHAWLYATRLRYRLAAGHKLGVEAMAPLRDANAPLLLGGYYGSLSSSWSIKLLAGTSVAGDADVVVRFAISRQLR